MPKTSRSPQRGKHALAVYGSTRYKKKVSVTYKKRVWKRRRDGIKQRYRKKFTAKFPKWVKGGERITLWGRPEDIATAKRMIEKGLIPKHKYVDRVDAEDFLDHPNKYSRAGEWTEFEEAESP